jgi:hypothetical protein
MIMSDLTKCRVLKDAQGNPTGVIVSPRSKMIYPSLFEPSMPKGEKDKDKARFQITLLIPKTADLSPMVARVNELMAEKLTPALIKTTKVKKPFLKVTAEDHPKVYAKLEAAGLDPADFPVMIRCAAKYAPSVLAANKSVVTDETQVYDGRWCLASINFYWYDHPTGGKGISAGLNNVQLLENDDVLPRGGAGGNASDEFDAVEAPGGADSVFD